MFDLLFVEGVVSEEFGTLCFRIPRQAERGNIKMRDVEGGKSVAEINAGISSDEHETRPSTSPSVSKHKASCQSHSWSNKIQIATR